MNLIKPSLRALMQMLIEGKHHQLFAEINIHVPMQFANPDEAEEMGFDEGKTMASCEFLGVQWLFFAQNGRIIDSDCDSL